MISCKESYCIYSQLLKENKIIGSTDADVDDEGVDEETSTTLNSANKKAALHEFKRRVCEQLVIPHLNYRTERQQRWNIIVSQPIVKTICSDALETHIIVENIYINGTAKNLKFHISFRDKPGSKFGVLICRALRYLYFNI